ncbi:hypothetical protein CK203_040263 [Vitis vinifera]|uniref:Reverse transcriptase domain-containing protein n=1 Tax=Vitis vinifera TaxID=29760 RepID=A0A438HXI6_VITVI|nr:hypothetical protein CK203_040263 [Vitis vinifera]
MLLLGLPSSESREFKTELSKPVYAGEISEQEASPMEQGRSAPPLKSYILGMFPISFALGGGCPRIFWPFFSFSFGDGGFCGDGRSFTLPGNDGASRQEGGDEALTLRSRGNEVQTPHLHTTVVGEGEKDKSPWVNRKFLGKPNESKRGTLSGSRKDRELKKLVSTINYDGLAGRVAEEGELGRQITVEIKMKEMLDRIVRSLGIGRNLGWVSLDARGSAGGVLVMWDKRVLEGLEVEVGSFLFHAALEIARMVLFGFSLVLIANEEIDSRKRSAGAGLMCKLDIEKAYDHVNWRMTVLVNDTPTEFFSTFRGLRQGDPLSPYLFVLIMEAFSSLISRAEDKGFIRGFKKSEIIPVGGVEDVDRVAVVFGCKVGNLPITYLVADLGRDKEVVAGVGRCTLEDPFKIGNWRRSLKDDNNPLFPAKEVWGSCNLCKENEELTDHILTHCGKTRELWTLLLSSFGVVWVFLDSVKNLLLEWKIKGLGKKGV